MNENKSNYKEWFKTKVKNFKSGRLIVINNIKYIFLKQIENISYCLKFDDLETNPVVNFYKYEDLKIDISKIISIEGKTINEIKLYSNTKLNGKNQINGDVLKIIVGKMCVTTIADELSQSNNYHDIYLAESLKNYQKNNLYNQNNTWAYDGKYEGIFDWELNVIIDFMIAWFNSAKNKDFR